MIPYGKHYIDDQDIEAVINVLKSNSLTQGPAISEFEKNIASYVNAKYAVAVSSGTAALHLATMATGLTPNDTLITSALTFVSSANCARFQNANVDFCDIDKSTLNLSIDSIKSTLSNHNNIKVIIPVHFAGAPCDIKSIRELLLGSGKIYIIEDAAHALGSKYTDGTPVGSCQHSDMTIFSFHPVKAIAAGEGGMITTNDPDLYNQLLRFRSHGINKVDNSFLNPDAAYTNGIFNPWYYEMQNLGYHYRITDIQSALGSSQLKKLNMFISRRRELAYQYDLAFSSLDHIKPLQQQFREESAHHLYPVAIDFNKLNTNRAEFMYKLRELDIFTQVHYIPVPMHPYYSNLGYDFNNYQNTFDYYQQCLSLPLYFSLTDDEQRYVIDSIRDLLTI